MIYVYAVHYNRYSICFPSREIEKKTALGEKNVFSIATVHQGLSHRHMNVKPSLGKAFKEKVLNFVLILESKPLTAYLSFGLTIYLRTKVLHGFYFFIYHNNLI